MRPRCYLLFTTKTSSRTGEGKVVYPSPMRPAGSKHQPWQANRVAHDGILNISLQEAPDGQRKRWRPLIGKTPVRFRRSILPAKNPQNDPEKTSPPLQPVFGTTVFSKSLRFSRCQEQNSGLSGCR
jgi:hypothetical protein